MRLRTARGLPPPSSNLQRDSAGPVPELDPGRSARASGDSSVHPDSPSNPGLRPAGGSGSGRPWLLEWSDLGWRSDREGDRLIWARSRVLGSVDRKRRGGQTMLFILGSASRSRMRTSSSRSPVALRAASPARAPDLELKFPGFRHEVGANGHVNNSSVMTGLASTVEGPKWLRSRQTPGGRT